MKRLIVALLPILLAAQIPLSVTKYVPSDLKKSFHFGVKWTGLLLESFSTGLNNEIESDRVPAGVVTTTVVLAYIPELEEQYQLAFDEEICRAQVNFAKNTRKAMGVQKEFHKQYRVIQIKSRTIQL